MKNLLCLLGFAALLVGADHAVSAAPVTIMPVGDSLTANDPGYRGPLLALLRAEGLDVEFVGRNKGVTAHEGFGGFTIGPGPSKADEWTNGKGSIHAQLDGMLKDRKPDYLILLIGVNDYFNIGDKDPQYKADRDGPARLGQVLDKIHALSPKTKVIYSSVLPVGWAPDFAKGHNSKIPALAETRPFAIFADLNKAVGFKSGDWDKDNLHLAKPGNEKLAKAWAEVLIPLLKGK